MPSLYESTVNTGEVSSSNFTTLYNASGLQVPNAGAGSVTGNLNVGGNLTVQGNSLLIGEVTLQSTLSLPNYTFPAPDGTTDQVLVTDGNGNLYWTDVSAIPGADYSISATAVAGGANITLENTAGFTDSVKLAAGTNIGIVRTDANTITISTTADDIPSGTARGQVLYWDGSAWTASANIRSATANDRLVVAYENSTAGTNSALFLRKDFGASNYSEATNDGVGLNYSVKSNSQGTNSYGVVNFEYSATDPQFSVASSTDNFVSSTTMLLLQKSTANLYAPNITLNTSQVGVPTLNASITVERGSSTNATITWDETDDRWELNNDLIATGLQGGNIQIGLGADNEIYIGSSQDLLLNTAGGTNNIQSNSPIQTTAQSMSINSDATNADSYLYMKGNTESLKWDNTNSRFEFSDQLYITQTDIPGVLERRSLSTTLSPYEQKSAVKLLNRVTDAADNDTVVTGPCVLFGRTSGATTATERIFATMGSNWNGSTQTAELTFNWSSDNFNEPTPGNFPGTHTLLKLDSNYASFQNNSIYIDYDTAGNALVGVNTGTPGYTLDVAGDTNVQGLLTVQADAVTINSDKTDQDVYLNFGRVAPSANAAIRWNKTTNSFEWSEDSSTWHDFIDATITNPQQGQFLTYDAASTEWINSSLIQFNSTTYRPRFQADTGVYGRTQSGALVANNTGAVNYTTGDGASLLMGVDSDAQSSSFFGSVSTAYNTTGDHQIRLSSSNNNFNSGQATSITGGNTLVFATAHGFAIGDKLYFASPTQNGLTYQGSYYVIAAGFTTTQCQVSTTLGGSAVALTNGTGLNLWLYNDVKRLITATSQTTEILAPTLVFNATNTGIPFTGTSGLEVERGTSGSNATFAWTEANNFWRASNDLYVDNYVIGGVGLATNGNNIYFNNEDGAAADCFITVKRPGVGDPVIKWNEATDRWQTTVDGSTYLNIPNQNLDTTDDVQFSSINLDSRAVMNTGTTTTTSTAAFTLDSTNRNAIKCMVYITSGTDSHAVEILMMRTNTDTMITTYGEMYTTGPLATFTADTSGSDIRIRATPTSATSTTFSVVRTAFT